MVIKLYKQGVPPKEIAHQLHMSLRDVYAILKREFGEKQKEDLSDELKAIKLYRIGKDPIEVMIRLRITSEEATQYYIKFKDLTYLGKFGDAYGMVKEKLPELSPVCDAIRAGVVTVQDFIGTSRLERSIAELEERHIELFKEEDTLKESIQESSLELIIVNDELSQAKNKLAAVNSELQEAEDRLTLTYQHLNYNNAIQNQSNNYSPYATFGYFNRGNYW